MLLFLTLLLSSNVFSQHIVDEIALQNWGFKNIDRQYYDVQLCEFPQDAKIAMQSIKALLPEKNSDVYPRFTLVREEYANAELAANRIEQLNCQKFKNSLQSKNCNLRKAQQSREFIFLVHTDAQLFSDQLEKLLLQFMEYSITLPHSPEKK